MLLMVISIDSSWIDCWITISLMIFGICSPWKNRNLYLFPSNHVSTNLLKYYSNKFIKYVTQKLHTFSFFSFTLIAILCLIWRVFWQIRWWVFRHLQVGILRFLFLVKDSGNWNRVFRHCRSIFCDLLTSKSPTTS